MNILSDIATRLRAVFFRRAEEAELEEELRFHVEMETEFRAGKGVGEREAARQSRIAFGGVEQVKDSVRDARGTRPFEEALRDVGYTLRNLGRNPGFAAVVILTLAIGIGGTTAVFSAVDHVLLKPLPYQEPGRLVRLYGRTTEDPAGHNFLSPVYFGAYRSQLSTAEGVAAIYTYSSVGADIGSGDRARRVRLLYTSANYFDVVRVRPSLGGAFRAEDESGPGIEDNLDAALVTVISHQVWQDNFHGDPAAVGKSLLMNGKSYQVVGVMPAGYEDPIAGAVDAWVPVDLTSVTDPTQASNHFLSAIARLRGGVSIEQAQSELDRIALRLTDQYPGQKLERARLDPLKDDIVGSSSLALELMLGAVGLVLVLVCVNIANLMLVRSSERTQEFALRSALGAGGARLLRQLLVESLTLAIAGALAGFLVARFAVSAIVVLGAGTIPRLNTLALDPRLLGFSLLLAVGCAVLFGLTPAIRAARTPPGDALRDQSRGGTSGGRAVRFREWLVISQVAMAFVLMVGAGLLLASFRALGDLNLGIKPEHVLTFELNLPGARYDSTARAAFFERFAGEVAALPGVTAAGGISKLPATGAYHQWGMAVTSGPLVGDAVRGRTGAQNRVVSGDYFRAVGVPLLEGRLFDARDDNRATQHVIISKNLAVRLFPGVSAVGQTLSLSHGSEVIGVVGDVAVTNEGRADGFVYHPHRQFAGDRNWPLHQVILFTGDRATTEAAVRRLLANDDPQLVVYHPRMLDEAIGKGAAQRLFTLRLLVAFAAMALALSALGLYGVLSYGVKMRTREFGIRMALGAARGTISGMVLRQGLIVASIGVGFGFLGAVALSGVMTAMLFQVSPLDLRVLGGAVLCLAIIAGIAAWLPAHRATAVDPRSALQ
ncbi:MAG: ABC transporter permease [Gemmatimonadales bacterium]